ncbi:MAG: UPF0149 family protein [Candidatus Accumulibacter sp. UW26]|jgi:uncharacterized protein
MTLQAQLSDCQLLRLEQLLDEPELEQAMRLDETQGYLCAALAGPQPIPEGQWLSEVLGDAEDRFGAAGREAAALLRLLAARLQVELASGEAPLLLLYAEDDDENAASDYVPWCEAYLHGIDTAPEGWFEALGADDDKEDSDEVAYLDEQLFPLFVLTGDAEQAAATAGEEWLAGEELTRMRAECEERLPQAVANIYRFWVAQRSVRTIRRDQVKVGRNDPCPCGSGRKFKKCCGATRA